jgi:hypothetical protein
MDPETIRALTPIIAASITALATILVPLIKDWIKNKRPRINWVVVAIFTFTGGVAGYYIGKNLSSLPFQFGGQLPTLLPVKILAQTPTPISRGELLLEINFSDKNEGRCNNYDPNLLGYENYQYYIKPATNGFIAVCHENDYLGPEGSLQVSAFPESNLQDPYGFALLFGWRGNNITTTDACIFGLRREGTTTRAFFENRVAGKISAYTQELKGIHLDEAPHTLRVVLRSDGNATGYLDEHYLGDFQFSKCNIGPVGLAAWGPGDRKIYFDDLKFFGLPR